MTPLYPGDRVRIVVRWGSFQNMCGKLVAMQGARPLVLLDGDREPTLFFAHEIARIDDETK
jgi:hypothetical protein